MHIVVKDGPKNRDPFKNSDRLNPIGGGKGDFDRTSNPKAYRERFPAGMGPKKKQPR